MFCIAPTTLPITGKNARIFRLDRRNSKLEIKYMYMTIKVISAPLCRIHASKKFASTFLGRCGQKVTGWCLFTEHFRVSTQVYHRPD